MKSTFNNVGVVGVGAMGQGIAQMAAQAGAHVHLCDTQAPAAPVDTAAEAVAPAVAPDAPVELRDVIETSPQAVVGITYPPDIARYPGLAKALGGGSGWMLLVFNPREGTLVNQWSPDHTHALAGGTPLLALDMYEHAYHLDFGTNAAAYVDACLAAIDWGGVYARYKTAVHAASEGFGADHDDISNSRVLDVRRAGIFEQVTTQLPGAAWSAGHSGSRGCGCGGVGRCSGHGRSGFGCG